jgi:glycyl-tRNA synthetase beta chain
MSRDLIIEIGVEELPASFLERGLESMRDAASALLAAERLSHAGVVTMGTPRRMALLVQGLEERQPDRSERVLGPPASAAFDAEGNPTRAALGFAQKNGAPASALVRVETEKGAYVAVDVHEPGKPTLEVLPAILGEVCKRIAFQKSMRWGVGDVAFGRPVHWLVGLFGDELAPFEFAGLTAGRTTRGHRFLAPDAFEIAHAGAYVERLREAWVLVSFDERRRAMRDALERAATGLNGTLVVDEFLLGECLSLVEYPFVVPGGFDERYLALPDEVVVSVMRDHQRYFAVRNEEGALLPAYLNVVNTANAPDVIKKGNDRVLRARLEDARFFVEEDLKVDFRSRVARLDAIVFQAKLGTVGDKVRRVSALAERLGGTSVAAKLHEAAQLAKADLTTLIVGEFPELQGAMGRHYALTQGVGAEVADAIVDHYRPQGPDDDLPRGVIGAAVAVADRADTLVGCFGIGLVPTGSADPFALRRATLGIVRIALEGPIDVDVQATLAAAYDGYAGVALGDREPTLEKLVEFFVGRLRVTLRDRAPGDVIEACLGAWDHGSLRDLEKRLNALVAFRETIAFESLSIAFKRAFNIAKDAPSGAPEAVLYAEEAERALAAAFEKARARIESATADARYDEALTVVASELRAPIDTFFNEVFVMVDDAVVRENRLKLLRSIAETVTRIAHFHLLAG